eukprot:TRINITY_DN72282_c0_g1_i1.p1 TRINITY_DN72282_c0_g1~~TRINITY_DN72282_c0_g1_i1.p1  ORF type:complete len:897 (+),score=169.91 TRINITY_DN72282_c0_g1_i1:58-2691(+)
MAATMIDDIGAVALKTTVDQHGVLEFRNDDAAVKMNPTVKRAVDKLSGQRKISLENIVKQDGVPQDVYLAYIKTEIDTENSCLELPLTIVILISFAMLALNLLHQEQVYALEEAYEFDIIENANFAWSGNFGHKGLQDVNSIADFWSWLRLGLIPLLVQPSWYYSESVPAALGGPVTAGTNYSTASNPQHWKFKGYEKPAPALNDYLHYGKMIGGIRMRQEVTHADINLCRFPSTVNLANLQRWLGKPCVPSSTGALTPENIDAEEFQNLVRVQYLFPDLDDLNGLKRVAIDMEDGCNRAASLGAGLDSCRCDWCKKQTPRQPWIDEQTARVEISTIIYNPQYGLYTYVAINFMFNRGGHIYKFVHCMSNYANPLMRSTGELVSTGVAAFLWVGALLYVSLSELKEILSIVRASGRGCLKALKDEYLGVWNTVDWISIFIGTASGFYWFRMRLMVGTVNDQLEGMVSASLNPDPATYQGVVEDFHKAAEDMALAGRDYTIMIIFYPLIIMLRLFKSFQAQPRLAIVTTTLRTAAPDLVHFFIVFLCVFICFLVNSILFFGQDLEAFSTVDRAFITCFLAMFGDWDWDGMKEIGMFKAAFWFWTFLLLMVLMLLNMLLAIIMDAYQVEKEKASDATTLLNQVIGMVRRRRQFKRGERVRLTDIYSVFKKEFDGDENRMLEDRSMITAEYLVSTVPRMPYKQALRTLVNSLARKQQIDLGHPSEEDIKQEVQKGIQELEKSIDFVREDVEFIAEQLDYFDRLQAPGDATYEFYFSAEGLSQEEASRAWIHNMVSGISGNLNETFAHGLSSISTWQDEFECEQGTLHDSVAEMQSLVQLHAELVADMSEAALTLQGPDAEQTIGPMPSSAIGLPPGGIRR